MSGIPTEHLQKVIAEHTQDMSGKAAVVTGTTSGTGYVCARELSKRGAQVFLFNRESTRADAAVQKLRAEAPDAILIPIVCDLQNFSSVQNAAGQIKDRIERLDVLCNNAGVMALKDLATDDGYDVQMQTNCISHFLLTKELFPLLKSSPEARVVNHSSMARLGGPLQKRYFAKRGGDLGGDGTEEENASFSGPRWERYHQTKLANCAFTYGLKQRLEQAGIENIKALVAHPGLAATNLQHTTLQDGGMHSSQMGEGFMSMAQSAEDGALGIIRGCMDPKAQSGDFFGPVQWKGFPDRLTPEEALYDPENIRINWEGCEAAVGRFEV